MNQVVVLTKDQVELLLELVAERQDGIRGGSIVYGSDASQREWLADWTDVEVALRASEDEPAEVEQPTERTTRIVAGAFETDAYEPRTVHGFEV